MRRRGWWPNVRGWERVDGWRIATPNPEAMETGSWFGLAYSPTGEPVRGLISGLNAGEAMDRVDALYPNPSDTLPSVGISSPGSSTGTAM
jgi:hypothetical protein